MCPHEQIVDIRVAGWSGHTVERAEFEALLMGLQALMERIGANNKQRIGMLAANRPMVHWTSDRESLVYAVARDRENGDKPFYRRDSTPDLWARFDYYERLFRITPEFRGRNQGHLQKIVDVSSSDLRNLVSGYCSDLAHDVDWAAGWQFAWADPERFKRNLHAYVPQILSLAKAIEAGDKEKTADLQALRQNIIAQVGRELAQCINYCAAVSTEPWSFEHLPTDIKGRVLPLL